MKDYRSKSTTNRRVTIPINAHLTVWLVCALIVATAITSSAAVQFNGTNSYATMNQSFLGGATITNFTIEFWVKNKRPTIDQHLGGKTEYWKEWAIGFPSGGRIHFMHAWPNTYYQLTTTNGVMKSNQWQHVAIVGQGTLGSIYVNGVLVDRENTLRGQISFNAAASGSAIAGFVLGFRDNTTLPDDLWFQGGLADFRIWDIALSDSQVGSIYASEPSTNSTGLRHWIPFNEGAGSTFTDIIGGLQGQLFNTTWSPASGLRPKFQLIAGPFASWTAAKTDAEARGGHLATITSEQEWQQFTNFVGKAITNNSFWWMGASDVEQEGVWKWVTGETGSYILWAPGEPSGFGVNGKEDYLVISSEWTWLDAAHEIQFPLGYVLEYEPEGTLLKAVKPSFANLSLGATYQLQISTDLITWANYGTAFTATNSIWRSSDYWDVDDWASLYFRLKAQ